MSDIRERIIADILDDWYHYVHMGRYTVAFLVRDISPSELEYIHMENQDYQTEISKN